MSLKGRIFTNEHKRKLSESHKGKKLSLSHRKRLSDSHRGKKKSELHKKNISIAKLGEKNPMYGKIAHNWKGGREEVYKRQLKKRLAEKERIAGRPKPERCEVCGAEGRMVFDHDHKTGAFRGWICSRCNTALGMVKDNAGTLMALAEYLHKTDNISTLLGQKPK